MEYVIILHYTPWIMCGMFITERCELMGRQNGVNIHRMKCIGPMSLLTYTRGKCTQRTYNFIRTMRLSHIKSERVLKCGHLKLAVRHG